LGPSEAQPRDEALPRLARRYLAGHGPADAHDLATWSGLTLGDARAGLHSIAPELVDWPRGGVALRGGPQRAARPAPRLLGQFDPLLHGWRSRTFVLGDHSDVVTVNGIFRAIALVGGEAAGTWRIQPSAVELDPFGPLPAAAVEMLEREAVDVLRYLGLPSRPLRVLASGTARSNTAGRRRP
jgi:hypothetical protein